MSTVLVVDDHHEIRTLIRLTLGRRHEIVEAEDGTEALRLIRSTRPDVVILDVMMPGPLNGLDVVDQLRADPATHTLPVILVTARGQEADRREGLARGASAYFIKPFSPMELLNCVNTHLQG